MRFFLLRTELWMDGKKTVTDAEKRFFQISGVSPTVECAFFSSAISNFQYRCMWLITPQPQTSSQQCIGPSLTSSNSAMAVLLLALLPLFALSLNSTVCKACLELVKYRLLEDELDLEDCLQQSPRKEALLDSLLVTHLLHCHRSIDSSLVTTVISRLPGLYLNQSEVQFLHIPIGNCFLEPIHNITSEDRAEYHSVLASAKEFDYKPARIRGWAIIGSSVLVCCYLGKCTLSRWGKWTEGRRKAL